MQLYKPHQQLYKMSLFGVGPKYNINDNLPVASTTKNSIDAWLRSRKNYNKTHVSSDTPYGLLAAPTIFISVIYNLHWISLIVWVYMACVWWLKGEGIEFRMTYWEWLSKCWMWLWWCGAFSMVIIRRVTKKSARWADA